MTNEDIREMYTVFERYYTHADWSTFVNDLQKKNGAIVVRRKDNRAIVGFSTVVTMNLTSGGRTGRGIFSGDTVLEQEYWGDKSLNRAFFAYIIREKLRHPLQPLYWLLISKGYKTYLLLANNFQRYYPHPENRCPDLEPIVSHYCEILFAESYDRQRGLLDFGEHAQRLKEDIAPICDVLRQNVPKIRYFEDRNPSWKRGTELPCVGHVNAMGVLSYVKKWLHHRLRSSQAVSAS